MFKNLKKKMEDVGADLTAVTSPGTLSSSQSSLRRSESKTSGLAASRESLQSIHSESGPRVIRTSSIASMDAPLASINSLPLLLEPDDDITASKSMIDNEMSVIDLSDAASTLGDVDSAAFPSDSKADRSLSLVDEPVQDSSPVLVPKLVDEQSLPRSQSLSPVQLAFHDNLLKEVESLRAQMKQKETEEQNSKNLLASRDLECMKLRTELERYKDAFARNRANEDRLVDASSRIAELSGQLDSFKLERDSWKIAHDQAEKRTRDKDSTLHTLQRKISDLDSKLSLAKTAISDQTTEIEKYREENASVKASVGTLDNQIDKLLDDIRNERRQKETAQEELRKQQETALEQIRLLNERIQSISEDHRKEVDKIQQVISEKDRELDRVRENSEDTLKFQKEENSSSVQKWNSLLEEKQGENYDLKTQIRDKEELISSLNQKVTEMEIRTKTLEDDLDSKETTLAIIKRRSAKDMESKLRERDRQIASLERQMQELLEKVAQMPVAEVTDHTSDEYKKNVLLRFVTGSPEEVLQLVRAVSVLLCLTPAEEMWLKEILAWKQSWLPGPKPELHPASSHNGT